MMKAGTLERVDLQLTGMTCAACASRIEKKLTELDGVTATVKQTPGAIGYIEYGFAKLTKTPIALLQNKAGKFVQPSVEAASAAMAKATVAENLTYSALDTDGPDAYPIVASTYILVYAKQTDATKGNALKAYQIGRAHV